jgi:hypothetical protein
MWERSVPERKEEQAEGPYSECSQYARGYAALAKVVFEVEEDYEDCTRWERLDAIGLVPANRAAFRKKMRAATV